MGMIEGHNKAGKLLVCHCSYGMNNVVVTKFAVSGFTAVGRQLPCAWITYLGLR